MRLRRATLSLTRRLICPTHPAIRRYIFPSHNHRVAAASYASSESRPLAPRRSKKKRGLRVLRRRCLVTFPSFPVTRTISSSRAMKALTEELRWEEQALQFAPIHLLQESVALALGIRTGRWYYFSCSLQSLIIIGINAERAVLDIATWIRKWSPKEMTEPAWSISDIEPNLSGSVSAQLAKSAPRDCPVKSVGRRKSPQPGGRKLTACSTCSTLLA